MIQSWSDIADILKENDDALKKLRDNDVFLSFTHFGSSTSENVYGWRMSIRVRAIAVCDVCRKCGFMPSVHSEELYMKNYMERLGFSSHQHSWSQRERCIGELVTHIRGDLSKFIQSLSLTIHS